jgi:hypothetical protein
MTKASPTLGQIMNGLVGELRRGKTAARIAFALNYMNPEIFAVAPLFFGLTLQTYLESADACGPALRQPLSWPRASNG